MLKFAPFALISIAAFLYMASPVFAEDANALMRKAIKLSMQGNNDEALKIFKEVIEKNPKNTFAHNNLGQIYALMGEWDKALASYKTALEINPNFAMTLNNIGQIYKRRNELDLAETSFKKAIQNFKNFGLAYGNLGEVYLIQKKYDDAISNLGKAVEIIPANAMFHHLISQAYQAKNMTEKADKHLALYKKFKLPSPTGK